MTDKELRRLSRSALLELLIQQMEENEELKAQLEEAQTKLESREIIVSEAGSIAQASLQLNEVFQAADNAAMQYLDNIRRMYEEQEEQSKRIEAEAREKADEIVAEALEYNRKLKVRARANWKQVMEKLQQMQEQG